MRNAFANVFLIAVDGGAIEMPIAGLQRDRDGVGYIRGLQVPCAIPKKRDRRGLRGCQRYLSSLSLAQTQKAENEGGRQNPCLHCDWVYNQRGSVDGEEKREVGAGMMGQNHVRMMPWLRMRRGGSSPRTDESRQNDVILFQCASSKMGALTTVSQIWQGKAIVPWTYFCTAMSF